MQGDVGEVSALIGSIYDCALDPERWPEALAGLCRHMSFRTSTLALQELPSGRPLLNYSTGIAPADLEEMLALSDQVIEAWGGPERFMSLPLEEPILNSRVNPAGPPAGNGFVEWGIQRGLVDTMAIGFTRGPDSLSSVGFGRHSDDGPAGDPEIALARLFVPHLKRAITISRLLEARTVETRTYADVLDGLSVGVLLLAPDQRLVHANREGEALLRSGDPLGLRHGRVTAPASVASALAVAMSAPLDAIGRRGLGIPARRSDGEELVLHLLPLPGDALARQASAALFVAPAITPRPAPMAALAALFELTRTEARVLELIAAGRDNAEIARALGIAVSTVRTHVLRLFDKTRTHRQAELVALVGSFSLPIA